MNINCVRVISEPYRPITLLRQPWLYFVQNDILEAFGSKQGAIVMSLDQSAVFDTIDHSLLVTRLRQRFGIGGLES